MKSHVLGSRAKSERLFCGNNEMVMCLVRNSLTVSQRRFTRFHNTQNSASVRACGERRYATSVSISMLEYNPHDLDARSR